MSKYTTQLRYPLEQKLNDLGLANVESNWYRCYETLGLDDYPIFDEAYRETLNNKIIRRYYMMEIGFETVGLFRWHLRTRMHEIMPYWNAIYKAQNALDNPLQSIDMNYEEEWTRDENITDDVDTTKNSTTNVKVSSSSDTSSSQSSTADDRNIFEDTPMNGLDTGAIENYDYATNVTFDHSTSSNNVTSGTDTTSTNDRNYSDKESNDRKEIGDYEGTKKHHQNGYDKSQSELLLQYRKAFVNIDLEIVNSLNDMFMLLW